MEGLTDKFKPLKREHAYWLRDAYANMARFRGRDGISVVHSDESVRVIEGGNQRGSGQRETPDFRHQGGLLSTRQVNRMIRIYNSVAAMQGEGVAVVKAEDGYMFVDETLTRGGSRFQRLPQLRTGETRETIFNDRIREPLVKLANAWANARATDPLKLTKSHHDYVLEGGCPLPVALTVAHTQAYTTVCGGSFPTQVFNSSASVAYNEVWDLATQWPFEENHDGICPLGAGVGLRVNRIHTAGDLIIGPYPWDAILFNATEIVSDDQLWLDGVKITNSLVIGTAGFPHKELPKNTTATLRLVEVGGAWCWAAGYFGAIKKKCATQAMLDLLP